MTTVKKTGRTLEAFANEYDDDVKIPAKIKAALETLGDSWVYEQELLRIAAISTTQLAAYRERFKEYWVPTSNDTRGKKVWAGTPAFAKQLRARIKKVIV